MSKAQLQTNNSELGDNNTELTDILQSLNDNLIDLTGDTVTAETLAEGATAHDASGDQIVGKMKISNGGTVDNYITEVGIMLDSEPVTIRDDGSRLTVVVNEDESIVETRTFLDGATETKTTVFNDDDTVTETTVTNGETTTKVTTFTDFGEIVMRTDKGNQIHYGETEPDASVGIDGDVFIYKTEEETTKGALFMKINGAWTLLAGEVSE